MYLTEDTNSYIGQEKILVAIDCVIFGFDYESIKVLLFRRKVEPLKGSWSLIGSFINGKLNLNDSAKQVLYKYTGLDDIYLEELKVYSNINRDPGARVISVVHYGLIRINEVEIESVEKYDAHWFNLEDIPELILDHREMIDNAINKLRSKAKYQPIGFKLLPKKFTIPQLQLLYECIYQKKLDNRNFRKKILSFNILTKTKEKDKNGSKKGAFLYEFNKPKFDKSITRGFNFEL